ncbi:hypothetical protein GCM10011410_14480 [Hoyosella rhizosphaerae]|uniref:Uncharacterized protein n=1 Tax=Hoyosella rhizosphaerae TaxID=1755582 RepID=A0A916U7F6_9ACTN|nr:hypothetical protein GCM10011410_14480 [Hoyosella rhizosphaerae]
MLSEGRVSALAEGQATRKPVLMHEPSRLWLAVEAKGKARSAAKAERGLTEGSSRRDIAFSA